MNNNKIMQQTSAIVLLLAPVIVSGFEYEAEVRAGIGVSDNIGRTPQLEVDETIATAGFDYGMTGTTSRVNLLARVNFDYLDYLDDTFDAEWVGGLDALIDFSVIEERLRWEVRDNFGQQLFDPFQPARPGNRENVNYFSTGPTLAIFPGRRNPVTFDARYSRVDYEERPFDNERLSGEISIGREVRQEATLSFNVRGERTEFDNGGLTPDVEEYAGFVRYDIAGALSTLTVDLGYNRVEAGGLEGDGVLADIRFVRSTSPNGTLSMSGGSRYSDQGDIFRWYQDVTSDLRDSIDSPDSAAPFVNNFFSIGYLLEHTRYSVDMTIDWSQEDYKGDLGIDRDLYRAILEFQREVSRTVYANANVRFHRREFKYEDRRDDDLILGLGIGYRFTPGFSVVFDYQHFQRNSITVGADFTENRAFVRLVYIPAWSR